MVWRNRKKISQIIKDYFYLPFFRLIILWYVPSLELGLFHPLSRQRVCPSPRGGHTRLQVRGWGSPNTDDWRKSLALCLLCSVDEAVCDCRALDLLDSTVVDTSLDINRGMWMQKVSRGALDLLHGLHCSGHLIRHKPWYVDAKGGYWGSGLYKSSAHSQCA
jgi:hypothetical protein